MLLSSLLFILFIGISYIIGYICCTSSNSMLENTILMVFSTFILVFNAYLVFIFYIYLADYFLPIFPIGKTSITILFLGFLWWISFLTMILFPEDYVKTRTVVGILHHCLYFLFNGFTSNVFKFNDDNIKTILNNSGGSPKLIWAWSDLPLSKFASIKLVVLFFVLLEVKYGNILNESGYMSVNSNQSLRYTYGLVILVLLLIAVTIVFSRSGNRVQRLSSLWFTTGFFQSFLGEKIPGVFLKNIFTNLSTSSLISFMPVTGGSKDETNDLKIFFGKNRDKQYELRILPAHIFFLSMGRILQVSFFIVLAVLSLLLFVVLIILCFCLILNYINASEFGDGTVSFYDVLKSLPHNSVNFSMDSIRSKLIVDTPIEWIYEKTYTSPDLYLGEEDYKVNVNTLSSKEDINLLAQKQMSPEDRAKFLLVVGIFFVGALLTSLAIGHANASNGA